MSVLPAGKSGHVTCKVGHVTCLLYMYLVVSGMYYMYLSIIGIINTMKQVHVHVWKIKGCMVVKVHNFL